MKAKRSESQEEATNELQQPRWSVVSFDQCEAARLTYEAAAAKLAELDTAKVAGLCIVTDEAAARMCNSEIS